MQGSKLLVDIGRRNITQNILVLAILIGLVIAGWLAGHILRYSIPALWHPPIQEVDPQIKTGYEFKSEGIRRQAVLTENPQLSQMRIYLGKMQLLPLEGCVGDTYYTSLPAKCRSGDGELVQVGGVDRNVIVIPKGR